MAGIKISEMPVAGALTGTELLEVVQSGKNTQTNINSILSMFVSGGSDVNSVNGQQGVVVLTAEDIGAIDSALRGVAGGIAELDSTGLLKSSQLPSVAITNTYVVVDEAEMLGLAVNQGDVAVRSDLTSTFIFKGGDPAEVLNWQELPTPTNSGVLSVNGKTGVVTLSAGDINALSASLAGVANGLATLDANGKLTAGQLPNVANAPVKSVNGEVGDVVLTANDVNALPKNLLGTPNGVAGLGADGKVPRSQLPNMSSATGTPIALDGPTLVYPGTTYVYQITNYNAFSDYEGSSEVGDVGATTVNGSELTLEVGVDMQAGNGTFKATVDGSEVIFTAVVGNVAILTPSVTSPVEGQTDVTSSPVVTSSDFTVDSGSDIHRATSWKLTDSEGVIVWLVEEDTVNLTSNYIPSDVMTLDGSTYTVQVRYHGTYHGDSAWSVGVSFRTEVNETPTAGSAFGGGYFVSEMIDEVDSTKRYYLVVSSAAEGQLATTSYWSDAKAFCENLVSAGFSDWTLPTIDEMRALYWNLKATTDANNTNYGASSLIVPEKSNYTSTNPSQTTVSDFQSTGAEDLISTNYWSSTEVSATYATRFFFREGLESSQAKASSKFFARAVRRVYV